jgi:hypothetical protein
VGSGRATKKLIDAVRLWAAGGGPSPADRRRRREDEAALGIIAADADDDALPADFEVWPENWDAFRLFCGLNTQWNHVGLAGVRVGLRYEAIEPTARMMGIDVSAAVFAGLQIAEIEMIKIQQEKS